MKEIKTRDAIRFLQAQGWTIIRSNGKHDVWASPDRADTLALPRHKSTPPGIVRQIEKNLPNIPTSWK